MATTISVFNRIAPYCAVLALLTLTLMGYRTFPQHTPAVISLASAFDMTEYLLLVSLVGLAVRSPSILPFDFSPAVGVTGCSLSWTFVGGLLGLVGFATSSLLGFGFGLVGYTASSFLRLAWPWIWLSYNPHDLVPESSE